MHFLPTPPKVKGDYVFASVGRYMSVNNFLVPV